MMQLYGKYGTVTTAVLCFLSDAAALHISSSTPTTCRYLPGDLGWPSNEEWAKLSHSVEGRLIAGIPLGASCHNSIYGTYDDGMCAQVQAEYDQPPI